MIVVCTAYDQYSLKAFETSSIDYLLKPVRKERLELTITKLRLFHNEFQPEKILSFLQEFASKKEKKTLTSITTRKGNKLIFIKLTDIVYFEADEKYVSLYTKSGTENIIDQTIKDLEENLPSNFLRVHRAIIINTQYIKELQAYFNSRYTILLDDSKQTKVVSGRSFQKQIKDWMGFN
jgi:two-component system LytT family response regulator